MTDWTHDLSALVGPAQRCHDALLAGGATVATAESLTGGLVGAVLTAVSGASSTYGGGVVAYTEAVKRDLLGVPAPLLARHGPVHPDVAEAMATGARSVLGTTYALATTGVAGPLPHGGYPAGTVYIARAGADGCSVEELRFTGDRARIRVETVRSCLELLERGLGTMSERRG